MFQQEKMLYSFNSSQCFQGFDDLRKKKLKVLPPPPVRCPTNRKHIFCCLSYKKKSRIKREKREILPKTRGWLDIIVRFDQSGSSPPIEGEEGLKTRTKLIILKSLVEISVTNTTDQSNWESLCICSLYIMYNVLSICPFLKKKKNVTRTSRGSPAGWSWISLFTKLVYRYQR